MRIRLIHQTYKTADNLPKHWAHVPSTWQYLHPEYKYMFWTDETLLQFVTEFYPWFLSIYLSLPYNIMRVDAARLLLLYHYGGVYADLDYEPNKNIDELFLDTTDEALVYLVRSPNENKITNSFMAASMPGCEFFMDCIKLLVARYKSYINFERHLYILNVTGPGLVDQVVKHGHHRVILLPTELIFPSACAVDKNPSFPCSAPGSYMKILEGSSWMSWSGIFYRRCYMHRWGLLAVAVVLAVILLIFFILSYRKHRHKAYLKELKNPMGFLPSLPKLNLTP